MDRDNLSQIFANYIEKFEYINNKDNQETYKWEIAHRFRPMMDAALSAPEDDFADALREVVKLTENLIDSFTQPFYGLYEFAKQKPNEVREMLRTLFADDSDNLTRRHQKIVSFISQSNAMRDELFRESYRYKNDYRSASTLLFLYAPDSNYCYKPKHAQEFADCIGVYDDWGSGTNVKLDVYYRVCDAVLREIVSNEALMKTDKSRFTDKNGGLRTDLFPDENKHILLFDIMYCCSTYNLFHGISYAHPDSKERKLQQERREKASELQKKYDEAREEAQRFAEAKQYLLSLLPPDKKVYHRKYKEVTVLENDGSYMKIAFDEEIIRLDIAKTVSSGSISASRLDASGKLKTYIPLLQRADTITSNLSRTEKELSEYTEYLD